MAFVFSCNEISDPSLDPVQTAEIKKGTELALRGTQLSNLYVKGIPGAEVFPKIMTGNENFTFDGELLAVNTSSLASIDVYAVQKPSGNRILLSNVPFSQFVTGVYKGPSVTVTYTMNFVLGKLGLPTAPNVIYTTTAGNPLLTTYQPGIEIQTDLNLVDGTQVLASQLVAAGLYQSNQFYPAQILTWTMTDYCTYNNTTWAGKTYISVETPGSTEDNKLSVKDPLKPNRFTMDNWWGDGVDVYMDFAVSTNPATQTVTIPTQTTTENGVASGTGNYNQCLGTIGLTCKYVLGGATYNFNYALTPK